MRDDAGFRLLPLRFGNVDWAVVTRIAIPGAIGGFLGATVLTSLSTESAAPWMAGLLFLLGTYVISRFVLRRPPVIRVGTRPSTCVLAPLGLFAGFVDATGGGGRGPRSLEVEQPAVAIVYLLILAVWVGAFTLAVRRVRETRREALVPETV